MKASHVIEPAENPSPFTLDVVRMNSWQFARKSISRHVCPRVQRITLGFYYQFINRSFRPTPYGCANSEMCTNVGSAETDVKERCVKGSPLKIGHKCGGAAVGHRNVSSFTGECVYGHIDPAVFG